MSTNTNPLRMLAAIATGMMLTVTVTLLTGSAQTSAAETPGVPLVRSGAPSESIRDQVRSSADAMTANVTDAISSRYAAHLERVKAERVALARAKAERVLKSATARPAPAPAPTPRANVASPKTVTMAPAPRPRGARVEPRVVTHHVPFTSTPDLAHFQPALDRCRGAVAVNFEPTYDLPLVLIAEHDYCGGGWVLGLRKGQSVKLTGHFAGTYRVTKIRSEAKNSADPQDLTDLGSIVLQTCSSDTTLRLVGLTRF